MKTKNEKKATKIYGEYYPKEDMRKFTAKEIGHNEVFLHKPGMTYGRTVNVESRKIFAGREYPQKPLIMKP